MGCVLSNPCVGTASASTSPPTTTIAGAVEYDSELSSYEAACRRDPEVMSSFDTALRRSTRRAISTLAGAGVLEVHAISLETLQVIIGCLLDMNQKVVNIIYDNKKDIRRSPELFLLINDYFRNSVPTINFCAALEQCLKKARDSQNVLRVALQRFVEEEEEDGAGAGSDRSKRRYERALEELRYFKSAGDPFTKEFFQEFRSLYWQQESMLLSLRLRSTSIGRRTKRVKSWRKLLGVIFVSAVAAVFICALVAALMASPPVAAAMAVVTAVPWLSMGTWVNSLLEKYSDAPKGREEVIEIMDAGTDLAIEDLDSIGILVERLELQISSLLRHADFALNDEEAVKLKIEEIKKKLEVSMEREYDLGVQADQCSRDIGRARMVVLQIEVEVRRIIKFQS